MKLYMRCHHCHYKTYIDGVAAESRITFAQKIHSKHLDLPCSRCGTCETQSVNDVYAEDQASIIGPAILIIGFFSTIFIGAIGAFIGCAGAAVVDAVWQSLEATCVRKFNTSVIM